MFCVPGRFKISYGFFILPVCFSRKIICLITHYSSSWLRTTTVVSDFLFLTFFFYVGKIWVVFFSTKIELYADISGMETLGFQLGDYVYTSTHAGKSGWEMANCVLTAICWEQVLNANSSRYVKDFSNRASERNVYVYTQTQPQLTLFYNIC